MGCRATAHAAVRRAPDVLRQPLQRHVRFHRANIRALADDGHDIEAHSINHLRAPAYVEANGLRAYLDEEVIPSIELLRADGYDPVAYAYPFGQRTSELDAAILDYVPILRSVAFVSYPWSPVMDPCPLMCHRVGAARGPALAESRRTRIVLADDDPELRQALRNALAPWHAEIVVQPAVTDDADAAQRATHDAARFVADRDADQLVVFDREGATSERRTARLGTFDPVSAAAAALTVKTMLRLPPPPPAEADAVTVVDAAPELRLGVGGLGRLAFGDTTASARVLIGALVRPDPTWQWRFGIAADLGTSTAIERSGFRGTWRDWSALAVASYTIPLAPWLLEPYAGAGVEHSALDGTDRDVRPRGVGLARDVGRWGVGSPAARRLSVAVGLRLQVTPSTPD